MIAWLTGWVFVWAVRVAVLIGSCLSMKFILADELGYRVEFPQLFIAGLLVIVCVRIWMPWQSPFKKEDRRFDDISGV